MALSDSLAAITYQLSRLAVSISSIANVLTGGPAAPQRRSASGTFVPCLLPFFSGYEAVYAAPVAFAGGGSIVGLSAQFRTNAELSAGEGLFVVLRVGEAIVARELVATETPAAYADVVARLSGSWGAIDIVLPCYVCVMRGPAAGAYEDMSYAAVSSGAATVELEYQP